MKRITSLLFLCIVIAIIAAGCSSKKEDLTFDKKHQPLPDYVLNSSDKIQETYVMAATYPEVIAEVPCYCGCGIEGHKSNLDCFVDQIGTRKRCENMGFSRNILRHLCRYRPGGGRNASWRKSSKKIYQLITGNYNDLGDPTPTPEPK